MVRQARAFLIDRGIISEELIALKEAVHGFVALVRQMVPPSQERDGVIESLENLHQAIARMLAS